MKIGIDMMGGDYAPRVTVEGFKLAYQEIPDNVEFVLFGNKEIVDQFTNRNIYKRISVVYTSETIDMGDEPTKAFGLKKDSGIVKGFGYLSDGSIDVFCSAGNSGAMLVGAISVIGVIKGIIRPSITVSVPREKGGEIVFLDAGLNLDCKPEILVQFAQMGSLYSQYVKHCKEPTVGLLNIGSEEAKGNLAVKTAFGMMKESGKFIFSGNVEGYDIFSEKCPDVVVCDGFVGNIILKYTEGLYALLKRRDLVDSFVENFNFEGHGGTPILGINKNVVMGHGVSTEIAIRTMIMNSWNVGLSEINKIFINAFENEKS